MEVPSTANVNIFECISSEGATANPLKKRSFRLVIDLPSKCFNVAVQEAYGATHCGRGPQEGEGTIQALRRWYQDAILPLVNFFGVQGIYILFFGAENFSTNPNCHKHNLMFTLRANM